MAKNISNWVVTDEEFIEEQPEQVSVTQLANDVLSGRYGDSPWWKDELRTLGYSDSTITKVEAEVQLLQAHTTSTKSSSSSSSTTKATTTTNESQIAKSSITIRLQANSQRDVQAEWNYSYKTDNKNRVDSYVYDWQYQTSVSDKWHDGTREGTVKHPTQVVTYSTPAEATKVRFRVKPVSKTYKEDDKDKTYFTGKVSSWKEFSGFVFKATPPNNQIKAKQLKLKFTSGSRPYVTATWPADSSEYVSHYDYKFEYYNPDTLRWEEAETGSTPNLTDSDRQSGAKQTVRMYVQTGTSSSQSYIPNYTQVKFTVIAVPTDGSQGTIDGSGAFTFLEQSVTEDIFFSTPTVEDVSLTFNEEDGKVYAMWAGADDVTIASYDIEWQELSGKYHFFDTEAVHDNAIWIPKGTGNVVATESSSSKNGKYNDYVYGMEPTVIEVTTGDGQIIQVFHQLRVRIKPRCDEANAFLEEWSAWYTWSDEIPSGTTAPPKLSAPLALSPRYVEATWQVEDYSDKYTKIDTASFTYEWAYRMKGTKRIYTQTSGSVNFGSGQWTTGSKARMYWMTSITAPSEAYEVLFRVKPEPIHDYSFVGQWSEYVSINFGEAAVVAVDDLSIGLYSAASRTLFAKWTMPKSILKSVKKYLQKLDKTIFNDGETDYTASELSGLIDSGDQSLKDKALYLIEKQLITGYEVNWMYYFRKTWFTGSSTTVAAGVAYTGQNSELVYTTTYSVPEEAKQVSVTVRPVTANEDILIGDWCPRVTQSIEPLPVDVPASTHISINWYEGEDRALVARAIPTDRCVYAAKTTETGLINFIFEWSAYRFGGWETAYTESVEIMDDLDNYSNPVQRDFAVMSTYTVPDKAIKVRLRVKPDVENYSYIGEWSDFKIFNVMIPTRSVKDLTVALRRGSDKTCVATWSAPDKVVATSDDSNQLDSYSYKWQHNIDGVWFDADEGTTSNETLACTYDAPDDASMVRVRVMPNPVMTQYFTGEWSSYVAFDIEKDTYPVIPDVPTLEIVEGDPYTFRASVEVYDRRASRIHFQIVDETDIWREGTVAIILNRATFQFPVEGGHSYRARAAAINSAGEYSREWYNGDYIDGWSNYSNELASYPPPIPVTPVVIATSSNSAELTWQAPSTGIITSYTVEFARKSTYFDAAPDQVQNREISTGTRALITDLDASEWFFRVCSNNSQGSSDWSSIVSVTLGAIPTAPTTWSNRTSSVINEDIVLYWTHNCADESKESSAQIELYIGGTRQTITVTPSGDAEDPYAEQETSHYNIPANSVRQETTIEWRVRTKGVMPDYGPWSTQRIIKVYSPPTIRLMLSDTANWTWDTFQFNEENIYTNIGSFASIKNATVRQFPIQVYLQANPTTQTPTSYILSIKSNNAYEEIDESGFTRKVVIGQEIFKKYYNTNKSSFITILTPDLVSFENAMSYTVTATVAMDSGLSAETSYTFRVAWTDPTYELNAEISYDPDALTTAITPYAYTGNRVPTTLMLSVFRRDFDGAVTKIADKIRNGTMTTVIDPHPSLDFARYRIIGQSTNTGAIQFEDLPGIPIGEKGIVIQWDEEWQDYESMTATEDAFVERPWNGSMIKLPYNITVSDSNTVDVENIEYIGRRHPVSYYGTQVGQKATWTAQIPKADKETIYGLRRLAVYMGNVYVREPFGSGYWATIAVSFNINYDSMIVPVTLDVTRVEGGM